MRDLYVDDKKVPFLPREPLFFVVGMFGEKNPTRYYTSETVAAAQARAMTQSKGAEFVVAQIRSFHQSQYEGILSIPLFNNQTWPKVYRRGSFALRRLVESINRKDSATLKDLTRVVELVQSGADPRPFRGKSL